MPRKKNINDKDAMTGKDKKKEETDLSVDDGHVQHISYGEPYSYDDEEYEQEPDDWQEAKRLIDSGGMRVVDN